MSAEQLRRAAEVLREHAEKAQHAEPWCPDYTWSAVRHVQRNVDLDLTCRTHGTEGCPSFDMYDGKYVALMHPPVGLLLADLFDTAADAYDGGTEQALAAIAFEAVTLAGAVLREETP